MRIFSRLIFLSFIFLPLLHHSASCVHGQEVVSNYLDDSNAAIPQKRPTGIPVSLESEWIVESEVGLSTQSVGIRFPLLFTDSGPPPIAKFGFSYTNLSAPDALELPDDLYEYSTGLSWVKKLNERWTSRTMLGMDFATDNQNTSSDAWRFTGGAFAIYQKNPELSWTFGAIALGRQDLPVVPAIGAVWLPRPGTRVDFILPNPKVNYLLSDDGQRQKWAYLGAGINGNTWGYERPGFGDDQLTYSDVRLVAGWESRPSAPVNAPFVPGRKYGVDVGYAFSRDLEFELEGIELSLDDAFIFRLSTNY
ncbi:MAG: DUF6268 family outer membrane beta-barrel protein [Planctomycetota bacterium]